MFNSECRKIYLSPYFMDSLFNPSIATFEEDRGGAYNQKDAEGFIRLNALRMRIAARRKRKR